MDRRIIPEAENKLLILYALGRIGPCSAMQLLQFMVDNDLMNYFTMQLSLSEMEEQGLISLRAHPAGSLLVITSQGAYTIGVFDHRIPISRRRLVDQQAAAWHERFRLEQQTPAETCPVDGGVCLRLLLMEGDATLMEVLLTLSEGDEALTFLQRRWRMCAQDVYRASHELLCQGEDVPDGPLPESAALQTTERGDTLVTLSGDAQGHPLVLMLSLPDALLARQFALRWPDNQSAFSIALLSALRRPLP